jgi:hypothetical protein
MVLLNSRSIMFYGIFFLKKGKKYLHSRINDAWNVLQFLLTSMKILKIDKISLDLSTVFRLIAGGIHFCVSDCIKA